MYPKSIKKFSLKSLFIISLIFTLSFQTPVFAQNAEPSSNVNNQTTKQQKVRRVALQSYVPTENYTDPVVETNSDELSCSFEMPKKPVYKAKFMSLNGKTVVGAHEIFDLEVKIQNTGNVPWFASDSGCTDVPVVNLGATRDQDRLSPFLNEMSQIGNVLSPNRIKMTEKRVEPMEIATFVFSVKAPIESGLYREYFAPVAEHITWMEGEGLFATDIQVGYPEISEKTREYISYIQHSTNLATVDLNGQKKIEVDLSEQKMYLKIGDTTIRTFPVSTGARRTPTPRGSFKILSKQEVRVAGKRPHYIMPKFMMFKAGGYGIHALPSLANDKGVFWREALNHIGTPRSHGCIRLLPDDANFTYDFADVGTPVVVRW